MKRMIERLFVQIHGEDDFGLRNSEEMKKRKEAIECLVATFTQEQDKLFDEYYLCDGACVGRQLEKVYALGFKTGVLIGMELAEFDPNH
ncbi:MAG: hypothetical protein IJX98_06850 [Clostridia bacterium]|nr:hypothetical protein [Clostridia bacterium]